MKVFGCQWIFGVNQWVGKRIWRYFHEEVVISESVDFFFGVAISDRMSHIEICFKDCSESSLCTCRIFVICIALLKSCFGVIHRSKCKISDFISE